MHIFNANELRHICASTVPIFKTLSYRELQKVNGLIRKKDYQKGNVLFLQGDRSDHLYIVRYGRVKIYEVSKDGRQQIVRILEQGDFFGELSLFKDEHHSLNGEAMEDTGLCMIPREDFKILVKENPEMSISIMAALSERLAAAENFIIDLTLKNIEERLASWLMMMADKQGIRTAQGIEVSVNLSRREIANLLGTTTETVSRKLTKFQTAGIITTEGHKNIIIRNKEKLSTIITD
ncbi:Crp/Fnr family transcriptional regulator [Peptococcaceae bacterium 1198_IL3148]